MTKTRRLFLSTFCLLLAGCHRGPQTADELQAALPRQFRGDLFLQGDTTPHKIVVEPREFTVRNAHLLEFDRVRYQIIAGSEVLSEGDAGIRGTISTPDLEIRVEEVTDVGNAAGADAMTANTFKGSFSADLHTVEAEWKSGYGQQIKLKATATSP